MAQQQPHGKRIQLIADKEMSNKIETPIQIFEWHVVVVSLPIVIAFRK